MNAQRKNFVLCVILLSALVFVSAAKAAQESAQPAAPEETVSSKEIEGEVMGITATGISILIGKNQATGEESEMLLPLSKSIRFVHKKNIKEIAAGDTVKVAYDEISDGKGMTKVEVKMITFKRPGQKKKFVSEPLSLKGVK